MRVAVLCNSRLGIPSIEVLAQVGVAVAIGIPDQTHEVTALRSHAMRAGIPLTVFGQASFARECRTWLQQSRAEAVLVYTFPFLVPPELLAVPSAGFLNFHFGLLPRYRGADPIFWQIRNREPVGAVTVHRMTAALDSGPIALQQEVTIHPLDTYGLHARNLSTAGARVTRQLVSALADRPDSMTWVSQDESQAQLWPRPGVNEVLIDWDAFAADEILALVRACNPWNKGALTFLRGKPLKITVAHRAAQSAGTDPPGTLREDGHGGWIAACVGGEAIQVETFYLETGFFNAREFSWLGLRSGTRLARPVRAGR